MKNFKLKIGDYIEVGRATNEGTRRRGVVFDIDLNGRVVFYKGLSNEFSNNNTVNFITVEDLEVDHYHFFEVE